MGKPSVIQRLERLTLKIGSASISPVESARNLGVIFQSDLSLDDHISSTVKSAYFQLHNIARIRACLDKDTTSKLVHAFVTSRLDFCNSLLTGLPACAIRRLQLVQNSAARLVCRERRSCHITPLLADLHWLPVKQRIDFKVLSLTFRSLHSMAPAYLSDILPHQAKHRTTRFSESNSLQIPRTNLKSFGDRAFSSYAPKAWNSLPTCVRTSPDLTSFKRNLKTHLFRTAFSGSLWFVFHVLMRADTVHAATNHICMLTLCMSPLTILFILFVFQAWLYLPFNCISLCSKCKAPRKRLSSLRALYQVHYYYYYYYF